MNFEFIKGLFSQVTISANKLYKRLLYTFLFALGLSIILKLTTDLFILKSIELYMKNREHIILLNRYTLERNDFMGVVNVILLVTKVIFILIMSILFYFTITDNYKELVKKEEAEKQKELLRQQEELLKEQRKLLKEQREEMKNYITSTFVNINNLSDISNMEEVLKRYYDNYNVSFKKEKRRNKDEYIITLLISSNNIEYYKNIYIVKK